MFEEPRAGIFGPALFCRSAAFSFHVPFQCAARAGLGLGFALQQFMSGNATMGRAEGNSLALSWPDLTGLDGR